MLDERTTEREELIYHLRVFDLGSDQVVGYVDDINTEGAKLLSEEPIPQHKVSRYRMELPKYYEGKNSVEFMAVTTWSEGHEASNDFCDCGVKFLDLDPVEKERISQLIGSYHL